MKFLIRLLPVVLLTAMLAVGCGGEETNETPKTPATPSARAAVAGDAAPDFTLESVDGGQVSLSDYQGKVVLLDFWATWCPPCRKGIPDLIELNNKYGDDLVVIGISVDRQNTIGAVPGFVEEYGINYPVVYMNEDVIQAYGAKYGAIQSIPTAFVLNRDGVMVKKQVGLAPKEVFQQVIESAM